MTRFCSGSSKAAFALVAVSLSCGGSSSAGGSDPQLVRLDPPRGVQIDIDRGPPVVNCAFTSAGGPRRVLLYEVVPPSALWRYFAQPRWKPIGGCETNGGEKTMQPVFFVAPGPPQTAAHVWLVTAWDSLSHGRWVQMERYTAQMKGASSSYVFGRPAVSGLPRSFVRVTAQQPKT